METRLRLRFPYPAAERRRNATRVPSASIDMARTTSPELERTGTLGLTASAIWSLPARPSLSVTDTVIG